MRIHGKQLSITEDGTGIYYDNILITDTNRDRLNSHLSFKDWVAIISKDENFDPKKYHPELFNTKKNSHEIK